MMTEPITGIVLSGGAGRRMGSVDKGLELLAGHPLVEHVLRRLGPQVDEILISANRNRDRYERLGFRVIADSTPGFAGPLAGLEACMAEASHAWVMTVPCDSPFLPMDLAVRLRLPMQDGADVAIAKTGDRSHPVFCLCRRALRPHLQAFLAQGGRRFEEWCRTLQLAEVAFDDEADAFRNLNSRDDLRRSEAAPD